MPRSTSRVKGTTSLTMGLAIAVSLRREGRRKLQQSLSNLDTPVVAESSQAQIDSLLARLTPPQREAVTHGDGPLLIFAGAGSGKTRVLTARIAYLIASHRIWPDRLLAVTFTNQAARAMRGRVETLVGGGAGEVWVGTLHSTAAGI